MPTRRTNGESYWPMRIMGTSEGGRRWHAGGAQVKGAGRRAGGQRRGRKEHVQIARRREREAQWPFREGTQQSGEAQMNKAVEERQEAQVVFEYSRDPMFR